MRSADHPHPDLPPDPSGRLSDRPVNLPEAHSAPRWQALVAGLALGASLGYGAYALWRLHSATPWLQRWRIQPAQWLGHGGVRIAALSLHVAAGGAGGRRRFTEMLRRIQGLGADVVVILDLAIAARGLEATVMDELAHLYAPRGRFFLPDAAGSGLLGAAGCLPLSREAVIVGDDGAGFGLAFLPRKPARGRDEPLLLPPAAAPTVLFSRDFAAFARSAEAGQGARVPLVIRTAEAADAGGAQAISARQPARYDETGRTLIRAASALPRRRVPSDPLTCAVTLLDIGEPSGW